MIPSWKQFLAAALAVLSAFSVVLGCELVKKFSTRGFSEPSLDAEAQYYFSEALQLSLDGKPEAARAELLKALVLDPDSAYLHFELAQLYALSRNYPEAIKEADQTLKLNPNWPEPYFFLADSHMMARRPDLAEPYAQKLVELAAQDPFAYRELSRVYELEGRMDLAVSTLEDFVNRNPDAVELRKEYARILIRAGRTGEAETAYQELLQYAPGDYEAWAEYADLEAARGNWKEAISALNSELDLKPDNLQDRLDLARLLIRTGQKQPAHEQLEIAKRFSGENPDPWLFSGFLYLQEDHPEPARAEFLAVLQMDPKSEQALYNLGLLEMKLKNWAEASKWFSQIPSASKLYPDAQAQMIWIAYNQGKKEEAIRQAQSLTESHPGGKAFWLTLVELYQKEERFEDAKKSLNEALKHIPEDPDLFYSLAIVYSLTGDNSKAIEFAQVALNKKPGDPELLNFIGYTWVEQNTNLGQAEDYLKRALELDPENGAILDSMGWLYFQKGRYQEALKWVTRGAEKMPDDPEIAKHLGQIYLKLGDRKKAREYFQKALGQSPRPALKKQLEDLLQQMSP